MQLHIRSATSQDIDESYRIKKACGDVLKAQGMPNWKRYTRDAVFAHIESGYAYVLCDEDHILGIIKVSKEIPSYYSKIDMQKWALPNASAMYVTGLAVDPAYQKKGLGTKLIEFSEKKAAEDGCDYLRLTVLTINTPLKSYYEKRGFTFVQEILNKQLGIKLSYGEKCLTS